MLSGYIMAIGYGKRDLSQPGATVKFAKVFSSFYFQSSKLSFTKYVWNFERNIILKGWPVCFQCTTSPSCSPLGCMTEQMIGILNG